MRGASLHELKASAANSDKMMNDFIMIWWSEFNGGGTGAAGMFSGFLLNEGGRFLGGSRLAEDRQQVIEAQGGIFDPCGSCKLGYLCECVGMNGALQVQVSLRVRRHRIAKAGYQELFAGLPSAVLICCRLC